MHSKALVHSCTQLLKQLECPRLWANNYHHIYGKATMQAAARMKELPMLHYAMLYYVLW